MGLYINEKIHTYTQIYHMHTHIHVYWGGWRCWWTDFVPEAIHNPVATKLLVSGLLT